MSNIISILLIALSLGAFFGYVDPTYRDVKELQVKQGGLDQALVNARALKEQKQVLFDKYNTMDQAEVDKLTKLLPDNIDNIRLIIDVDSMAQTYGMRIKNFKTDVGEKKDTLGADTSPYGTLTLSFSVSGGYNQFLAFIRQLEKSLRIIDVTSIKFSSSGTAQFYDYDVTVKTYWLK